MNTSQNGINLIRRFEGVRLTAYRCPAGIWTVGYGHTGSDVKQGLVITQARAEELLKQDLRRFENYVAATKLNLNQNQFDALVSFTYNCGSGCLQTLVKGRTLNQIADALLLYNKAAGKVLEGLTNRRKAERELFLKGVTQINEQKPSQPAQKKLPYDVKTTADLNIRSAAGTNYPIVRTVKKGTILKVWAVCTSGGLEWGKNGNEYYCLKYCKEV